MANTNHSEIGVEHTSRKVLLLITAIAVLAGVYFRFKGLGFSPFAIDEYYLATSVKNILEHGVPRFDVGGYYTRGILLQYLVAPLFASGMSHELAFRLVTVVFSLAALPAIYLLARHMAGVTAGCLAIILYSLAVWEVEFARFARMYSPFGAVFLWYLYFLYRRIMLDDARAIKWMHLLTLVAVFLSEFAIFVALLNFLPLILRRVQRPLTEGFVPGFIIIGLYYWLAIPFRRLGAPEHLPPDLPLKASGTPGLPVHLPPVLLPEMATNTSWLLGFMLPLLVFVLAAGAWVRWSVRIDGTLRERLRAIFPIGVLGLALANLFGLAFCGIVILFLLSRQWRRDWFLLVRQPLVIISAVSIIVSLIYWSAYVASTYWWRDYLPISTGNHIRDAALLLFNYPNVFRDIVVPWGSAMPLQSALTVMLIFGGTWLASNKENTDRRGFLLVTAIALGLFILVSVFEKPYYSNRYTFFLYPVLLVLCSTAIVYCSRRFLRRPGSAVAAGIIVTFLFMFASEDFNARHLLEIDSERVTFRMGYPSAQQSQYYARRDFRTPADYVNANAAPEDIVISAEYGVPYYLERLDYLYMDHDGGRFGIIAGDHGTRDIWEGARLLWADTQLFDVMRQAQADVWFIAKSDDYRHQTSGEKKASRLLGDYRVYRGVDDHLDVYKIPSNCQCVSEDLLD